MNIDKTGPIKHAVLNADGADTDEIIAGVSGKGIRVLDYVLVCSGACTCTWQYDSTPISGAMELAANTPLAPGFNPAGHFETAEGEGLDLVKSAAVNVDGHITYQEIDPG